MITAFPMPAWPPIKQEIIFPFAPIPHFSFEIASWNQVIVGDEWDPVEILVMQNSGDAGAKIHRLFPGSANFK